MQTKGRPILVAKGKGAPVLNHKPTKVLQLSTSNPVVSRKLDTRSLHQKLDASKRQCGQRKASAVREDILQQDTQEDENKREGNGMICKSVSLQPHHFAV